MTTYLRGLRITTNTGRVNFGNRPNYLAAIFAVMHGVTVADIGRHLGIGCRRFER